jgi:hypothetical protein
LVPPKFADKDLQVCVSYRRKLTGAVSASAYASKSNAFFALEISTINHDVRNQFT